MTQQKSKINIELTNEQKQAIADGLEATLTYNSMASQIDPNKLFSVEPMRDIHLEKDEFCKSVKWPFCDGLFCSDCKKVQKATTEFLKNTSQNTKEIIKSQSTIDRTKTN